MTWLWFAGGFALGALVVVLMVWAGKERRTEKQANRQLLEMDRDQASRLLALVELVAVAVDAGGATGLRIEKAATGVANELELSQGRADRITEDPARKSGDAADAAAGSPPADS